MGLRYITLDKMNHFRIPASCLLGLLAVQFRVVWKTRLARYVEYSRCPTEALKKFLGPERKVAFPPLIPPLLFNLSASLLFFFLLPLIISNLRLLTHTAGFSGSRPVSQSIFAVKRQAWVSSLASHLATRGVWGWCCLVRR